VLDMDGATAHILGSLDSRAFSRNENATPEVSMIMVIAQQTSLEGCHRTGNMYCRTSSGIFDIRRLSGSYGCPWRPKGRVQLGMNNGQLARTAPFSGQ